MQPPGASTTGVNPARLTRARGWGDWNFAPTLPRPPAPPPEVQETEPEPLKRLAREARAVSPEQRQQTRAARQQYLSEPITLALGHLITAAGSVQAASEDQTGPALVVHVSMSSDIEAAAAVLTNGAFLYAFPGIPPAGTFPAAQPGSIPLWDVGTTVNRNSVAPGPAGGSLWWGPRILIPWATFRIVLQLQINAAITRQATALIVYQRVGAEYREPDIDLMVMRTRRPQAPAPPETRSYERALPSSVLVQGPGYQRQISFEALDPGLKVQLLDNLAANKPTPGMVPLWR